MHKEHKTYKPLLMKQNAGSAKCSDFYFNGFVNFWLGGFVFGVFLRAEVEKVIKKDERELTR